MKELVVISGKGGTGKTSIVASLAALAERAVLADCDVDAADLHLVLEPKIIGRESFSGGKRASINLDRCIRCGKCAEVCRFGAVWLESSDGFGSLESALDAACDDCSYCKRSCSLRANSEIAEMVRASQSSDGLRYAIDPTACEGCGVCAWFCPANAIEFGQVVNGEWFISQTRFGPMVHAKLGVAEENSGKLVTTVRTEARKLADQHGLDLVIIDGSPGIGCPVIASITGASLVLIVTEPTLSAKHDMERVTELTRRFEIPAMVCVNKWDLNPQIADEIEALAGEQGVQTAGRVRYDRAVTQAQIRRVSVVEYQADGCAEDIRSVWSAVRTALGMAEAPSSQ